MARVQKSIHPDERAKYVFEKAGLTENMHLANFTNAKFINTFFGQNLSNFMRSRWVVANAENIIVWLVEINGTENDGWINYDYGDTIVEDMSSGKTTYARIPVRQYALTYPYRIVVQKDKRMKTLTVRGVYKFDDKQSINDKQHYYVKI